MKVLYFIKNIKRILIEGYNYSRNSCFPAGHYYSPIVNFEDYKKDTIRAESYKISDINLKEASQVQLISSLSDILKQIPDWNMNNSLRYQYDNKWFPQTDAIFLYSLVRKYKPKRIIEIGSGYSSALMIDTNSLFFDNSIHLTFIEPNPKRLESLTKAPDYKNIAIIRENVQNVDLKTFEALQANDLLFIDSSHISKTGSDVNFLFFNVFPLLPSGVIIHLHDIFYPFEYPMDWIQSGRNWNEIYLLRAFLQNNNDYEIVLFVDQIQQTQPSIIDNIPCFNKIKTGSSLYLLKK